MKKLKQKLLIASCIGALLIAFLMIYNKHNIPTGNTYFKYALTKYPSFDYIYLELDSRRIKAQHNINDAEIADRITKCLEKVELPFSSIPENHQNIGISQHMCMPTRRLMIEMNRRLFYFFGDDVSVTMNIDCTHFESGSFWIQDGPRGLLRDHFDSKDLGELIKEIENKYVRK